MVKGKEATQRTIDPLNADYARTRPDAFARVLARGSVAEIGDVLARLPASRAASIAARLPSGHLLGLLNETEASVGDWLSASPLDDATALLSRLPAERRLVLVNSVPDPKRRRELLRQQRYPAHSVGALVRDVSARVPIDASLAHAVELLHTAPNASAGAAVVVDVDGRYKGNIDFQRLASTVPVPRRIDEVLSTVEPLLPETSIEVAADSALLAEQEWLPVVDHQARLLGCVSRPDLLRAATTGRDRLRQGFSTLDLVDDVVASIAKLLDTAFGRRSGR